MLSSTHPHRGEYGEGGEAKEVRGGLRYKFAVRIYQFKDIRPGRQRILKTNHTQARNKPNALCATHVNHHAWLDLGAVSGLFFVIEEVLLFFVLIVIKHRVRPILSRITEVS